MFDCWTVRLPNVRLRSIGKIFLRVRLSLITEPNRTQSSDWVRLGSISYAGIIGCMAPFMGREQTVFFSSFFFVEREISAQLP